MRDLYLMNTFLCRSGARSRKGVGLWCLLLLVTLSLPAQPLWFSSGLHGKIFPCAGCPDDAPSGGLLHAASHFRAHEAEHAQGAWFDLGNAFTGGDLRPDQLSVLPEIYESLGVDAMNVAAGDFRYGVAFLHELLADSALPVISASLVWEDSKELIFDPAIRVGGEDRKLVLVGISEAPAGRRMFPQLRKQFAGIDFLTPAPALNAQLQDLSLDVEVGVLYDGSVRGLRELREAAAGWQGDEIWIAAASEVVSAAGAGKVKLIPVAGDGSRLTAYHPGEETEFREIPLTQDTGADAEIREWIQKQGVPFPAETLSGGDDPETGLDFPLEKLEPGKPHALHCSASNRGLRVAVHELRLESQIGGKRAREGRQFAVLELSFENRQAIDLLLEQDYVEPLKIGELRNQLFLVYQGQVVSAPVEMEEALTRELPQVFTLSRIGSRLRGKVVFEVPEQLTGGLSLVYVPEIFPALEVVISKREAAAEEAALLAEGRSPGYLELGVISVDRKKEIDGFRAPEGMVWAVVWLQGRSLNPLELDARAVDVEAAADAKIQTAKAAVYKRSHDMLQLVVDGRHACRYDLRLSDLEPDAVFLPGRKNGGRAVFPIPEQSVSLHLYAGFPDFRLSGKFLRPEPIVLELEGTAPGRESLELLASIEDAPLPVDVTDVRFDPQERTLRVELTLRNTGEQGGMYAGLHRGVIRGTDGEEINALRLEGKGGLPLEGELWIPADQRLRSFSYVFELPFEPAGVEFVYSGVSKAGSVMLDLGDTETKTGVQVTGVTEREEAGPGLASVKAVDDFPPVAEGEVLDFPALVWEAPEKKAEDEVVVLPPGDGISVDRQLTGDRFLLHAQRLFVLNGYYGKEAAEGMRLLAVEVKLQLQPEVREQVDISDLSDLLFLRSNGRRLRTMRMFSKTDPQLAKDVRLDADNPSLQNYVFFEVPEAELASAELLLAEPQRVPLRLPLFGELAEEAAAVKIQNNRAVELGLYGVELRENFQGRAASRGAWLVVDLRGRSLLRTAEETAAPLRFSWRGHQPRMQLILNGNRTVLLGSDGSDFMEEALLLPEMWSGGRFAFDLTVEELQAAQSVQLQCGFEPVSIPGEWVEMPETLYFDLKGRTAELPPDPEALQRVEDLNFQLELFEAAEVEEVAGASAGADAFWVKLDMQVTGVAETGFWFELGSLLNLIAPDRNEISLHQISWQLPEGPADRGRRQWIPRDGKRRFSLYWKVKREDAPVKLRVNGVKTFAALKLFPGESGTPDPEGNLQISERGLQVLNPEAEPQGIAGVGLQPAEVNDAIDRGRDFLWLELQNELLKSSGRLRREFALVMLALVHCDAHLEYPEFDRVLRKYVEETRVEKNTVYQNALLAMTIEGYGDPAFLPRMEQIAHWLVETQGEDGTWSYHAPVPGHFFPEAVEEAETSEGFLEILGGESPEKTEVPAEPIRRSQDWQIGKNGDNSCTQFAVLGLWSIERSGIQIDDEVWRRVLTRMTEQQTYSHEAKYGGFGYHGVGGAYGSMTAAGICVMAIGFDRLFDDVTPREHLRIRNALDWMVRNFSVVENPEKENYNFYFIYSLERVGQILGIDFMGEHEWYPLGAKYLLGIQNGDGSWPPGKSESDPLLTTAYALLFLTRATPELDAEPEAEPTGPGTLVTGLKRPDVMHQLYLILDASGSMRPEIGGKQKLDIAREAVVELLESLPEETQVAVRVYGHRKRAIEPDANTDTELVVPWMPLDVGVIRQKLAGLRPMGKTPMALSLKQAAGEISSNTKGKTLLVLLTDGGENNRETDPVAAASVFAEREGVKFFVLGFDINRADWTEQLQAMAEAGKGVYRPVKDASLLARDLRNLIYPPVPSFEIFDPQGAKVAAGVFGEEEVELKKGTYTLKTPGLDFSADFYIRPEGVTRMTLDMAKFPSEDVSDASPVPTGETKTESKGKSAAAFCTQCGNKLSAQAKFCTGCGAKIR